MSAIFSKNENTEVFLFDGNEKIGKKIYISGKGRCNITNSKEIYEFFDEINRNKTFLYSSLYKSSISPNVKISVTSHIGILL